MRKLLFSLIFLAKLVFAVSYLPALTAFQVKALPMNKEAILVNFDIAPEYHIYQKSIKIQALANSSVKLGQPVLPDPVILNSPDAGSFKVYDGNLVIQVPILDYANGKLKLQINYQGCKGLSLCYPEQQIVQELDLDAPYRSSSAIKLLDTFSKNHGTLNSTSSLQIDKSQNNLLQDKLVNFIRSNSTGNSISAFFENSFGLIVLGFFIVGVMIAFTPCVFPLLPILIGVISGPAINTRRSFYLAFSYILGGAVIYALAGVIAASLGYSLAAVLQSAWLNILLSILFVIFAVALLGAFNLQIPQSIQGKLSRFIGKLNGGSLPGAFMIGAVANLILSPCVTAPLAGALVYISTTGNQLLGATALFALGFGSGVPLLLIAVLGKRILPKSGAWMLMVKNVLALLMLLMAIYMLSKVVDSLIVLSLCVIWLMIVFLVLVSYFIVKRKTQIVLGVIGLVLIVSVGANYILNTANLISNKPQFIRVDNLDKLDHLLKQAKADKKPVLIDYYASWCVACKEMELQTFINPEVAKLMGEYTLIQADISLNNSETKQLQQRYQVIAPPSIVFLDDSGRLLNDYKVTGFINSKELSQNLRNIVNNQANNPVHENLDCKDSKMC